MNGRLEHEDKSKVRIDEKLNNSPSYIRDFYESLNDKTYTTREQYIFHTIHFINYLNDKGFDINDVEIFKLIKPSDIRSYINSLTNMSETSKAAKMYGIKCFFDFLCDDDYIDKSPFNKVRMPKDNEERKITYLTPKEIKKIKNNIINGVGTHRAKEYQDTWKTRDMAVVMTALSLGLRVSSLIEINMEDIDFDNNTLKIVEKGNKIRTVMFSDGLKEILQDWINDRHQIVGLDKIEALFISNRKQRMSTDCVRQMLKKYTYNIDKHITPHKLRSTCATNVYNATGDIYLTANVLGHSNIANTRRYADISEERKQKAATAMDKILF